MSLQTAAYHEAGHVVMMMITKQKGILAMVKQSDANTINGYSVCKTVSLDGLLPNFRRQEIITRIKILLAGGIAESFFCTNDFLSTHSDKDAVCIEYLLRHLGPEVNLDTLKDEARATLKEYENMLSVQAIALHLIEYHVIKIEDETAE